MRQAAARRSDLLIVVKRCSEQDIGLAEFEARAYRLWAERRLGGQKTLPALSVPSAAMLSQRPGSASSQERKVSQSSC